jgi:hypothetical protein
MCTHPNLDVPLSGYILIIGEEATKLFDSLIGSIKKIFIDVRNNLILNFKLFH